MRFTLSLLIIMSSLMLLNTCLKEAPRDNVFDPDSELYGSSGTLQGTVSSKYPPYDPVAGLMIELIDDERMGHTDELGLFEFSNLLPGRKSIRISGDGFIALVDTIDVGSGNITEYFTAINGEPRIESVELLTRHIAHWQPLEAEYILDVSAVVGDYDGSLDIDSVLFEIPDWDISWFLSRGESTEEFVGTYFNVAFEPFAYPELQGVEVLLTGKDKSGDWGYAYSTQVSRLIVSTPDVLSPVGLAVVDSLPVFRWLSFDTGFSVEYEVNIFRLDDSAIPVFILASPALAETNFQWQASHALSPAQYYWTLTVIDRYGNISVSREASFIVE